MRKRKFERYPDERRKEQERAETRQATERGEQGYLQAFENGKKQKNDSTQTIRKTAEDPDGVREPIETREIGDYPGRPTQEKSRPPFRPFERPKKRHKGDPG